MTNIEPINHSLLLLQQLASAVSNSNEAEVKSLITMLTDQLKQIKTNTVNLQTKIEQLMVPQESLNTKTITPILKSGCYVFPDEKGFYCPHCYDNNNKVPTTRINSKLRVCPACRASIK